MRFLFITCIIFFGINVSGQRQSSVPVEFSLRTSLISPLESDANFMLGLGAQWSPRWQGIVDAGYIYTRIYDNDNTESGERDRANGLKLRTELRYYLNDFSYGGKTAFYIAPAFHYKTVTYKRWEEFGINCTNGNCNFFQIATYKRIKQETGGLFMFGAATPMFKDLMSIEAYLGLGVKFKKHKDRDIPVGGTLTNLPGTGFLSTDRDGSYMMLPAGIKLSLRLSR